MINEISVNDNNQDFFVDTIKDMFKDTKFKIYIRNGFLEIDYNGVYTTIVLKREGNLFQIILQKVEQQVAVVSDPNWIKESSNKNDGHQIIKDYELILFIMKIFFHNNPYVFESGKLGLM